MSNPSRICPETESLDCDGVPPNKHDFDEDEDGILVVTRDDKFLLLIEHNTVRCGASGTGEGGSNGQSSWEFIDKGNATPGLFKLIEQFPNELSSRLASRKAKNLSIKRWYNNAKSIGHQLFDDRDITETIIENGWDYVFKQID